MLYKADRRPSTAALTPVKTAREHIAQVARRLGAGSTPRAMLEFANEYPKEFWTQLYAKTIEREISVKHGLDDSLTGLLSAAFTQASDSAAPIEASEPIAVIAAPVDSTIEVNPGTVASLPEALTDASEG